MGEITDRLLNPPFVSPEGQPSRPPQNPEESRITERLLGSRQPQFTPRVEEGNATRAEFDFPEITQVKIPGLNPGQTFNLASGLLFALDEAQQVDIINNNLPGSQIDRDRNGNLFVTIPGVETPVYINRPGPSPQDATQIGSLIGPGIAAGRAGAAAGTALLQRLIGQAPARVAGVAGAEAALSAGTDVALQGVGSEQPPNLGRAAAAGAFGAGGEVLIPALARLLLGARRQGTQVFSGSGETVELTAEARRIIQDAGLDPDTLSQDFIRRLNVEATTAATPAQAQRVTEAATLPVEVPLTRGNATRNPEDQMFEDLASKGSFGRTVQSIVQGTRDAQQFALRANTDQIQAGFSGGTAQVIQRGQGGELVSEAINDARASAQRVVDRAYESARNSGAAQLPADAVGDLATNLEKAAADRLEFSPRAQSVLKQFRELTGEAGEDAVDVEAMFNWRRRVTTLAKETTDLTDSSALRAVRDTFDAQIVDIVEAGLLRGDDAAVDLWLNAINQRAEFGAIFQAANKDSPNYLVDLLTQRIPGDVGETILRVDPTQATNAIFGMSNTGFVNRMQMGRQLSNLERTLRANGQTDAWNALREEAFMRLAAEAEGPFIGSTNTRSFSGARFAGALDRAMERNLPVMMALFTKAERALMQQLQRTALATTTVTAGGANFSNTAVAQSLIGRMVAKIFGPVFRSAADTIPLASLPSILRASRATTGSLPSALGLPPGVGGGIGATVGPPASEEIERRF